MLSRAVFSRRLQTAAQARFTSHVVEDVDRAASRAAVNHPAGFIALAGGAAAALWIGSVLCYEKSEEYLPHDEQIAKQLATTDAQVNNNLKRAI